MREKDNNQKASPLQRFRRSRGFVLLIVIISMIVLSLLAIEFQQESFLQVNMSRHRHDVIQCDYALESGLAAASKLIQQYHEEMLSEIRRPRKKTVDPNEADPDMPEPSDVTPDENDPNKDDPNKAPELPEVPEKWTGYELKEAKLQVGKAEVTINIYGESYKLPLLWAINSPFEKSNKGSKLSMVRDLFEYLEIDAGKSQEIIRYLEKLTSDIEVAYCPTVVKKGDRWVRSGKSYTNEQINLLTIKNHIQFSHIGSQWYRDANNKRYPEIREMLTLPSGNLASDYLGLWGAVKININTAPAEVLAAAFGDIGMTMELAEKLVESRESQGLFRSPILIREIEGFEEIYTAIYPMADVIDHVYTAKITARSGEVTKTKSACFYRKGNKLEILAVF